MQYIAWKNTTLENISLFWGDKDKHMEKKMAYTFENWREKNLDKISK